MNKLIHCYVYLISFFVYQIAQAQCLDVNKAQIANALNAVELTKYLALEAAQCDGIEINANSISFNLSESTQKINNGIRSEVSVDYPYKEGDEVSYYFSIKFPQDFSADTPQNPWWLVAQWHDQPDKRIGQTWQNFPANSPPVAFYLEARNGITGIGIVMFGNNKKSWAPVPLGEWMKMHFHFKWSTQNDGLTELSVDKHPEFNVRIPGKNMLNSCQHYLKIGQYRHPSIKLNSRVMFKNLSIEH